MTTERIYYCDGPDCPRHVQTAKRRPESFIFVTGGGSATTQHFCTWDCVLRYAAAKPPSEVMTFD
jgi:hypothetical protein